MTVSRILWNYLWIAPALLQIVIVWLMLRRSLHRQFPLFFIYTAYTVCEFLILFPMYHLVRLVPDWLYGYTRLSLVAGGAVLGFGVTYEIFIYVGRNYRELNSRGKTFLRFAILILFAATIVLAQHTHISQADDPAMFTVRLLDRSVVFLQCGLMLGVLGFSRVLHMQWQRPAYGIALGLAVYASAYLILLAVSTHIGYYHPLDYGYLGSYHGAVLVWLYYFATPEKIAKTSSASLPNREEFEAWSHEIERFLQNR